MEVCFHWGLSRPRSILGESATGPPLAYCRNSLWVSGALILYTRRLGPPTDQSGHLAKKWQN